MDLNTEKLELIRKIAKTNDVKLLKKLRAVFDAKEKEVWDKLTPEQQEEINLGIQNENRGDEIDF
ncbi:hypothetical protein [Flavobacterium gilvum]|uniref:Uncharacterized protein n=1 Tax=Flavobacterium gilvum TaxID=1492737 RepID=A0AAC9I2M2_9FLAO|nr:hypothetical protein [Flavobacterium gilvum]AOW08406.1 hypothetical protein EM308_02180 [Flavobacterium gilvum]KFC58331.1 hypothetical protein FEM08_28890 [Flavobacterium gilvum]